MTKQLNTEQLLNKLGEIVILNKPILNIGELSRYTGISKSSIYKFTCKGTIPFYKQAKHLYFDREEINQWLKTTKGYSLELAKEKASINELHRQTQRYKNTKNQPNSSDKIETKKVNSNPSNSKH